MNEKKQTGVLTEHTGVCSKCGGEPSKHAWKGMLWLIDDKCNFDVPMFEFEERQ